MKAVQTETRSDNLGKIELLFPTVVLPQLVILLVVLTVAALKPFTHGSYGVILPDLSLSLVILCLLVGVGLVLFASIAQLFFRQISTRLIAFELCFFNALIFLGSALLSLENSFLFMVPGGIAILNIAWLVGRVKLLSSILIPNALLVLGFLNWRSISNDGAYDLVPISVFILFNLIGLLICRFKYSILFVSLESPVVNSDLKNSSDLPNRFLAPIQSRSLSKEYVWKMVPVFIAFVSTGLSLGLVDERASAIQVAVWLSSGMIITLIGSYSRWQSTSFGLQLSWLTAECVILCVWLNSYWFSNAPMAILGFFILVITYGMTPWSWKLNLAQAIIFTLISFLISFGPLGNPYLLPGSLALIVISMFLAARNFVRVSGSALETELPKIVRDKEGIVVAQVLGEAVRLIFDCKECLILSVNDALHLLGSNREVLLDPRDKSKLSTVRNIVKGQEAISGFLKLRELDKQLYPLLVDCLGYLPEQILFFRLQLKGEGQSESHVGLAAVNPTMKLLGSEVVGNHISSMVIPLESTADISRKVGVAQTFGAAVKELVDKDDDINEIIHGVNNAAQELTAIREEIEKRVLELKDLESSSEPAQAIQKFISAIQSELSSFEGTTTTLAAGVSDAKWLGEAAQTRKVSKLENVPFNNIFEELVKFTKFRLRRSGVKFEISSEIPTKACVRVVNREFLEASLRTLVRVVSRGLESNDHFSICISQKLEKIEIQLACSKADVRSIEDFFSVSRDQKKFKAIQNFLEFSQGSVTFSRGDANYNKSGLKIQLMGVADSPKASPGKSGWVLLLDDKPEILSFYGSVAQALDLPFGCAQNLTEARNLLRDRGAPMLLVTDIQLDQENGLDLVREFRDRFGNNPSVIVVSGNVEENVKDLVFASGASRYLTKPVGRRRLFLEIKDLLARD
jgi:CheY-like chemotaxis protein